MKKPKKEITVGVLALQGAFAEHISVLQTLGVSTIEVRLPEHLSQIDGLIIPGGESTTIARLLDVFALREPLIQKIQRGMPVWGTCAGMILLAKKLKEDRPIPLGVMNIEVSRNAFGRQIDSFEESIYIPVIGEKPLHIIFIRAPIITSTHGDTRILASLKDNTIVAAQEKNMLATAFHPELTQDTRFHSYFIKMVRNAHILSTPS